MAVPNKVKLNRLAFVVYEHPDLERFRRFATDFGFTEAGEADGLVFWRGYGKDQYVYAARQSPCGAEKKFIGGGFAADSQADFDAACQIPGAEVVDVSSRPGGGKMVKIIDPNGFEMLVIWDQEERVLPAHGVSAVYAGKNALNGALDKTRKGEFTRMNKGPAMVHKLGHFGYQTDEYDATCHFYQKYFNIVPTEILWAPGNESLEVATFFRVDLDQDYSDHHCFLLTREAPGKGTNVHHASFEVEDIDTQFIGHQWLEEKGHDLVWGIGRHVHGSQVFDYWYDSSGWIIEHYADGDLVNRDAGVSRAEAGNMAVWGPPAPIIWGGPGEGKKVVQVAG